ncbi:hypothetical protein FRX31_033890, partial [Thalictrum thalictroides]
MSLELMVLVGNFFVIGCIYTPDYLLEHWGMVFDPILNEWTSLPVPPSQTRLKIASGAAKIASCAVIDEKQFIVSLIFGSQLCVFDIESWNWSFIQLPRPCKRRRSLLSIFFRVALAQSPQNYGEGYVETPRLQHNCYRNRGGVT